MCLRQSMVAQRPQFRGTLELQSKNLQLKTAPGQWLRPHLPCLQRFWPSYSKPFKAAMKVPLDVGSSGVVALFRSYAHRVCSSDDEDDVLYNSIIYIQHRNSPNLLRHDKPTLLW